MLSRASTVRPLGAAVISSAAVSSGRGLLLPPLSSSSFPTCVGQNQPRLLHSYYFSSSSSLTGGVPTNREHLLTGKAMDQVAKQVNVSQWREDFYRICMPL